jgi:hypothetical protein
MAAMTSATSGWLAAAATPCGNGPQDPRPTGLRCARAPAQALAWRLRRYRRRACTLRRAPCPQRRNGHLCLRPGCFPGRFPPQRCRSKSPRPAKRADELARARGRVPTASRRYVPFRDRFLRRHQGHRHALRPPWTSRTWPTGASASGRARRRQAFKPWLLV